jgi:hypothetical protein
MVRRCAARRLRADPDGVRSGARHVFGGGGDRRCHYRRCGFAGEAKWAAVLTAVDIRNIGCTTTVLSTTALLAWHRLPPTLIDTVAACPVASELSAHTCERRSQNAPDMLQEK